MTNHHEGIISMKFHPLAELFPLMDGAEFDALVTSIKQNGQRDPIVTLDGAILDGRNRFRACKSAGVDPIFERFSGRNPILFVLDRNIHRRHLTEGQRAMIVAEFARLKRGHVEHQRTDIAQENNGEAKAAPVLTIEEAARVAQVSRATVSDAKVVLQEGTPEEITAVREGRAGVGPLADRIRKTASPKKRKKDESLSNTGKNPERIARMRENASIWSDLKTALECLTSLPAIEDVIPIARAYDKQGIVDKRILSSLDWLETFANAWSSPTTRNDQPHAANGGRSTRT